MEDTLGVRLCDISVFFYTSLNPCFNGRYSRSRQPCDSQHYFWVLILVLMEDTLGAAKAAYEKKLREVLILVLMEDTLGAEPTRRLLCLSAS